MPFRFAKSRNLAAALLFLAFVAISARTFPANAASPGLAPAQRAYLDELLAATRAQRLWDERFWHLLLHYRADTFGSGYTSEADGPLFFTAPEGRTDPRAELEATLAAFFSAELRSPLKQTAQCAFPARYRWLDEQLHFDPARLPVQPCEVFERWYRRIGAGSVSLVFSSYYFNNPASMFGHTLLRFDRAGAGKEARLLDFAVNYAASVPEDENGIVFAWRGLFGGYDGYFSVMPYYLKVQEYSEFESRDLWEYRLNFSPSQVDYLLRHAWEMGSTYFQYFFFDENCSYHLLSLLEVADPRLHLTDEFPLVTLPGETIRLVTEQPGLVREVVYRPSRSSQMSQKLAVLTPAERDWVDRLIDDPDAADDPAFAALPPTRQALTMDTAIDYQQFHIAGDREGQKPRKALLRRLLLRRSKLRDVEAYPPFAPRSQPPERSHRPARVGFAGGASRPADENRGFAEFQLQPVFHDLMSREAGLAPNSQINALHLRARYEEEPEAWRLERLSIVDLVSLFPFTRLVKQPSWRLALGWQRNRDIGCEKCTPGFVEGGIGLSVQTGLYRREVWFALLEASAEWDRAFAGDHRAGMGASAGVLVDLTDAWRVGLFGRRIRYREGDQADVGSATLRQRYALSQNLELRLDWRGVEGYREAMLGLGYYF